LRIKRVTQTYGKAAVNGKILTQGATEGEKKSKTETNNKGFREWREAEENNDGEACIAACRPVPPRFDQWGLTKVKPAN
jgi:hypothetical protein